MMRVADINLGECFRISFTTITRFTVVLEMPTLLHSAKGYGSKLWFLCSLLVSIAAALPAAQIAADSDGLDQPIPSNLPLTLIQHPTENGTSDLGIIPPRYSCYYDPKTPVEKPFPQPLDWYSCSDVAMQFKHDFNPAREWKLNTHHTDKRLFHLIKTPWTYGQGNCAVRVTYSPKWSQPVIWPEEIVDETMIVKRRCVARKWPPVAGEAGEEEGEEDLGQDLYKWGGKVLLQGTGAQGVVFTVEIELMPRQWLSDGVGEEGEAQGPAGIVAPVETA